MNRSHRFFAGILIVAAVGLAIVTLRLWVRDRTLSVAESDLSSDLATNRRMLSIVTAQRRSVGRQRSATETSKANVTNREPVSRRNRFDRVEQVGKIMRQLPEYAAYNRALIQRQAMRLLGEWFSQLTVPPERLAVLKQTVAENMALEADAYNAMSDAGYTGESEEYKQQLKLLKQSSDARLRQALTPEEYASYHRFDVAKGWVGNLREIDAFFTERGVAPLTVAQRRNLVDAVAQSDEWKKQNSSLAPGILSRTQANQVAANLAPSLEPERQRAFAAYVEFFNLRSKLRAELYKPEDPDSIGGFMSGADF
jgi:hypothetical protein